MSVLNEPTVFGDAWLTAHDQRRVVGRVGQARTRHDDLLPQRVWALRKNGHEAAIDLRAVPGIGAELVLCVDGEFRRARLYRAHEQAELSQAIADTRATFEANEWS